MRRVINSLVLLMVLATLIGGISPAHASSSSLAGFSPQRQEIDNVITFGELGYDERIMSAPYDSIRMLFSAPSTWQLQEGGKILLRYSYSSSLSDQALLGGTLFVYFNNTVIATIYLDQSGQVTREIPIPASALQAVDNDGRHIVTVVFDASMNCDNENFEANLIVSAESEISFSYATISPEVDLSKFPQPFYQRSPLVKIPTTIVVPDQPTTLEMQAALAVSSGLGAVTFGEIDVDFMPIGNLTDEARLSNNLIFVGLPSSFPILQSVNLPATVASDGLLLPGASDDDGVVQIVLSPWNPAGVLMFVSGTSEQGLVKAASILGSNGIFTSGRPDIVVISDVNKMVIADVVPDLRTFADLGYGNYTFGDSGGQYASYSFYVSAEQVSTTEAYIDLVISRSSMLDFEQTGASLILNGEVIATLEFSDSTSHIATTRIALLPNVLRRGNNLLEVVADLKPKNSCLSRDLQSNWITISESSAIYTPSDGQKISLNQNAGLENFPYIFLTTDNLSDVAFVLPRDNGLSWSEASKIAYYLGENSNIVVSDLMFVYGDEVSEEILSERNLILVGRATKLPFINQLGDTLPAPFESGSDEAIQPAMSVNYRLLPGVDVGYLQLLESPWNSDRVILAVMGNTDAGIPMASSSLIQSDLAFQLAGNFAVVYNDQIVTADTRLGLSKEGIVAGLPIVATVPPQASDESPLVPVGSPAEVKERASWLLPSLLVIALLVVVFSIVVLRKQFIEKNKEDGKSEKEE